MFFPCVRAFRAFRNRVPSFDWCVLKAFEPCSRVFPWITDLFSIGGRRTTFQVPILVGSRIFWKGFVKDGVEEAMMAGGGFPLILLSVGSWLGQFGVHRYRNDEGCEWWSWCGCRQRWCSGDELLRENGLGESPAGGISAKPNSSYQQLHDITASITASHSCYLQFSQVE